MAAPTITSLSPSSGLTRGRTFVLIIGTGFATQAVGEGDVPSMQVLFGADEAEDVRVESSTRITCISPAHDPGAVSVTASNIGTGESVTRANAYTYGRPDLTARSNLQIVVESVVAWLRRELLDEVALVTHSEYTDSEGVLRDVVQHARLPAVVLEGPKLLVDPVWGVSGDYEDVQDSGPSYYEARRAPYRRDLSFSLTVVSELMAELLSLVHHATISLEMTPALAVILNPGEPDESVVRYDLDVLEGFDAGSQPPRASNVRTSTARFVVRGVTISEGESLAKGPVLQTSEDVQLVTEQLDG